MRRLLLAAAGAAIAQTDDFHAFLQALSAMATGTQGLDAPGWADKVGFDPTGALPCPMSKS
jgi:predicted RNA-binding Zn ribbon-like protein